MDASLLSIVWYFLSQSGWAQPTLIATIASIAGILLPAAASFAVVVQCIVSIFHSHVKDPRQFVLLAREFIGILILRTKQYVQIYLNTDLESMLLYYRV